MFVDYSNVFRSYNERFENVHGRIEALVMACSAMAGRLPDSERDAVNLELQQSLEKLKQTENISTDYLEGYECVVSQVIDSRNQTIGAPDDTEK